MNTNSKPKQLEDLGVENSIKINDLGRLLHDAKLPITVLQSISDIMFKLNEQEEMENYIFMLDSNIKFLIRIMESLKDEITELDNSNTVLLHTDLIGYTEMIVDAVRPVCEINNVEINYNSEVEYYEYSMNYRFYERIILNVLKNSIRHAKNLTEIDVEVIFEGNKIKVCINDNGQNNNLSEDISGKTEPRNKEVDVSNENENFIEKSSGEGLYIITSLAKKLKAEVSYLIENSGMQFTLVLETKEEEYLIDEVFIEQISMEQIRL